MNTKIRLSCHGAVRNRGGSGDLCSVKTRIGERFHIFRFVLWVGVSEYGPVIPGYACNAFVMGDSNGVAAKLDFALSPDP